MRFWNKSLMARLVTYFLTLSAIGVAITTLITLAIVRNSLTRSIYDRLEAVATLKEDELNRWVNDQRDDLAYLSVAPDMRADLQALSTAEEDSAEYATAHDIILETLIEEVEGHPSFSEMFVMSSVGGKVLASTEKGNEGQYRVSDSYFTQGRLDLYVQNVYTSPQTGQPAMTISAPVRDARGNLLGVIAIHINLERLDSIILQRAGLGDTGETYIVDRFNNFISAARSGERAYPRGVHTQGIDASLQGEDGQALYTNYGGVPVIGVYRWMDDREMALLAEISQQEALAPIQRVAVNILASGLAAAIILALGVYLISRQIARPLLAINAAANQMAAGNLDARAPELTKDEVGRMAVSFNVMAGQIHQLVGGLEQRVAERTADLASANRQSEKRATDLQVVSEVARAVSTEVNLEELLTLVTNVVSERFGFYHVGVFLLDNVSKTAVLRASNSPGGKRMVARGHKLPIGQVGIVGHVAASGEPRIALDVGKDATFFNNPDLPETRSEMALPLSLRGHIIGILDVQSTQSNAFTQADVETLNILADQVAIAIENARLLAESKQALAESQMLYGDYISRAWEQKTTQASIGYQHASGTGRLFDEPVTWDEVQAALNTGKPAISEGHDTITAVAVPIRLQGQMIGILDVRSPEPGRVWTRDEVAIIEAIAERLALALENARLFEETSNRAAREHAVAEITSRIRETNDPQAMIRTAIQELQRVLNVSRVEIIPQVVSAHLPGRENEGQEAG